MISQFDLKIARLIGVRIVATDAASIAGGTLVYETTTKGSDLRLFRIDDVNLGQYSPIRAHPVSSASETIALMKAPEFDGKQDVVVEEQAPAGLVAASSVAVTVDYGPTLVVRARSPGRSLLVLPFEFSHCLRLHATDGSARILPVNLQQTGLLFEGSVTAEISYRFGLLADAACRGEDRARADRLNLKEALLANRRATRH